MKCLKMSAITVNIASIWKVQIQFGGITTNANPAFFREH